MIFSKYRKYLPKVLYTIMESIYTFVIYLGVYIMFFK